jgi:tetratricopeptide (TPR) repeat protein
MRCFIRSWIVGFLLISGLATVCAQIPDEFTNLKLLPKDISKGELIGTMRDWAVGLGVRCSHCHVGPDNLQGMDFASDEKTSKQTARRMLEMSRAINGDLLKDLPTVEDNGHTQVVSCFTCHRGLEHPPRNIAGVVGDAHEAGGATAAIEKYRELRSEYFGTGQYDFSSTALTGIAGQLAQGGKSEDALLVLEMGREYYPESADIEVTVGMIHMMSGKMDEAEAGFRKALEIDPENRQARGALARLEQMKAKTAKEP